MIISIVVIMITDYHPNEPSLLAQLTDIFIVLLLGPGLIHLGFFILDLVSL